MDCLESAKAVFRALGILKEVAAQAIGKPKRSDEIERAVQLMQQIRAAVPRCSAALDSQFGTGWSHALVNNADQCVRLVEHNIPCAAQLWANIIAKAVNDHSQLLQVVAGEIKLAERSVDAPQEKPRGKPSRRRRTKPADDKPLTQRQAEVVHIVAECEGNISKAAKQLGRNPKTVRETYATAMEKLGKAARPMKPKTLRAAVDKRGQETVRSREG